MQQWLRKALGDLPWGWAAATLQELSWTSAGTAALHRGTLRRGKMKCFSNQESALTCEKAFLFLHIKKNNKKPNPDNASFSYATRLFLAKACARWEMFVPCRNPARLRSEMTWGVRSLGSLCSGKKYNLSSRCVPESCLTGSLRGEYSEKQNICRKWQTRFLA